MANNYQTAVKNWTRIQNESRAQGLPDNTWQKLAQQDISNVLQGRTPMAFNEAVDAVKAANLQHSQINKEPDTGGVFEVAGNALHDIANFPVTFLQGAKDYVTTLPQQLQDFAALAQNDPTTQAKYGIEPGTGDNPLDTAGQFLRNMARTPVFGSLIPGLHTVADLTSPAGREDLQMHPGNAAIDVLAASSAAGGAGAFGDAPTEAQIAADPSLEFSAKTALQQGKPAKALARVAGDVTPGFDRVNFRQWLDDHALSNRITHGVVRPMFDLNRVMQSEVGKHMETEFVDSLSKLPKADRERVGYVVKHYGGPEGQAEFAKLPVEQQHLVLKVQDFVREMEREGLARTERGQRGLVSVPVNGRWLSYARDSEVGKSMSAVHTVQNVLERAQSKLDAAKQLAEDRRARVTGTSGKVRRWGEPVQEFAKRDNGPVGLDQVHESARNLIDKFVESDPKADFRAPHSAQVTKDLNLLSGEGGLFAELRDALNANDAKGARSALNKIARIFRHDSWNKGDTFPTSSVRDYVAHLRKEVTGIYDRTRAHSTAARRLVTAERDLATAQRRFDQVHGLANKRFSQFLTDVTKNPHASFHPLIDENIRAGADNVAKRVYQGQQYQEVSRRITESTTFTELKNAFGPDHQAEVKAIYDDATKNWADMIDKGYDPIWMQNVDTQKFMNVMRPRVLGDRYVAPAQFFDSTFNMGRSMYDVVASVSSAASNLIAEKGNQIFVEEHVMPLVADKAKVIDQYRTAARAELDSRGLHGENTSGLADRLAGDHWVEFKPENYGIQRFISSSMEGKMIPKGVDKALTMMMKERGGLPIVGEHSRPMKVFKYAVLTGPRHLAHVGLGGLMFMMLRDPEAVLKLGAGYRQLKSGVWDPTFENIGRTPVQRFTFLDDAPFNIAAGKTLANIGGQIFGSPARLLNHLEETLTNTYKIATTLSEETKGLSREAAVAEASKTFVDLGNLNAFERSYLKSVMPFYAFTKHLFRYLLTYPADHPYRMAIMNNFAKQAQEEWNTGLPQTMMNLFMLGSPDASGNVQTVDYRSVNPFRSLYSDFTLAGVLSQLNPAFTMPFQLAGINILSATPDLYPQLTWDPQSGQLVAVHDVTSGTYESINAFIPEFGAVDHFIGLTDRTRSLKKNNPEAYHNQLWGSLNLPLNVADYNIPYEISKNESRRYKLAQSDVSAALNGDWGRLGGYSVVPVPSYLQRAVGGVTASPERLQAVWSALTGNVSQGVSPRALISRSR